MAKSLDGLIQSWNPAAEHIFGFTAAEAIGQPVTMLIPWERREEENQILERVQHGEQVHLETIRLTKTGQRINASVTVTPLRDAAGRLVGAAKLLRNISDQKRAHEALSRLSRKLITAQEEERARIARELHDDIGQRLALLTMRARQCRGRLTRFARSVEPGDRIAAPGVGDRQGCSSPVARIAFVKTRRCWVSPPA